MGRAWQENARRKLSQAASARTGGRASRSLIRDIERHVRLIQRDGSLGVHNPELVDTLLSRDLEKVGTDR